MPCAFMPDSLRKIARTLLLRCIPPLKRWHEAKVLYEKLLQSKDAQNILGWVSGFRPASLFAAETGVTLGSSWDDSGTVERIVAAYGKAAPARVNLGRSEWQGIFDRHMLPLHQALMAKRHAEVGVILRNPGASSIFWGIDTLTSDFLPLSIGAANQGNMALTCLASLVRLAEATGAMPIFNPEQSWRNKESPLTADQVLDRLDTLLSVKIRFPNPYPNELGVLSTRGIASYRAIHAIYQAWRIAQLVKGKHSPRVLEIGAGLGRTAYYARLLGIKDYTIVDLAVQEASQAYFLASAIGGDSIALHGESEPDMPNRVKLVSPEWFLASNETYDLVVNVDSMTEMDIDVARGYWKRIRTCTSQFLSINHDFNPFTVKQLMEEGPQPVAASRYPYWMRAGYVEELAKIR
jgi:hypothetical protein